MDCRMFEETIDRPLHYPPPSVHFRAHLKTRQLQETPHGGNHPCYKSTITSLITIKLL